MLDSYGKVASKRIIDNVPMIVENSIMNQLINKLREKIKFSDNELTYLMAEN